jgi:hypothetical protein
MKSVLSLFFTIIFSFASAQNRIISGEIISSSDAPWMANIRVVTNTGSKLFDRSGVIISEYLILTAAHQLPDYDYDHLSAYVGDESLDGDYHRIHRYIIHPYLDLALLELSEPLNFSNNIQAVDYISSEDETLYRPGTDASVYGWGTTIPDDINYSTYELRAAKVKLITVAEGNALLGVNDIAPDMLVSRGESKISMAGKGDSGGSLIVWNNQQKPVLAGITILVDARNISVNTGLTVYQKVKPVIEWIADNKCEILGSEVVPSSGMSFEIANMPPNVKSVDWIYSGLAEINSTTNYSEIVSSNIETETEGSIGAVITTDLGSITLSKPLHIMPRIDIDVVIGFNKVSSTYEMQVKAVNMGTLDNDEKLKCKDLVDDNKILGFIWNYSDAIEIGHEAMFKISRVFSNPLKVSVIKYDCDHTIRLEKTFTINKQQTDEFVPVFNNPGVITVGSGELKVNTDVGDEVLRYSKNTVTYSAPLETSPVKIEQLHEVQQSSKSVRYKVTIYSRTGNMLYYKHFDSQYGPVHIDTSALAPDIYIVHIQNLDTEQSRSFPLIISS